MGDKPKYRVIELADPRQPDLPRAVFACRCDCSPWRAVWQHRNELQGKLARWFRELADSGVAPVEMILLGRAGVHEKAARAIARFRIEQVAAMAGCAPGTWPEFMAMDPPVNTGKRGKPVYADGVLYPSRTAAGRATGITPRAVYDRLRHAGWNWF